MLETVEDNCFTLSVEDNCFTLSVDFIFGTFGQVELEVVCSLDVAVGHAQLVTAEFLQVSGLRMNEQFIDCWDLDAID